MIIKLMITVTVIISLAMIVGAVYYKIKLKEKEERKQRRKNGDNSNVDQKDSEVKDSRILVEEIEDIRDGILITDNGTRFISAIVCRGVDDFYTLSSPEQMTVMKGYRGFINTITVPHTYRMYTKELDMDYTLKKYSDRRDELIQRYKFLEASLVGIPEEKSGERNRIQEEIKLVQFHINHLTAQMNSVSYYSSSAVAMEQVEEYLFEWKYRALDFDTELTFAERFLRAKMELEVQANAKIDALYSAGVKARVCTNGELIDICRRVSQPISVERFRMKELEQSSYFDDIITSESMKNMGYVVAEEAAQRSMEFLQELFSTTEDEKNENAVLKEEVKNEESKEKKEAVMSEETLSGEEVFTFEE